MKEVENEPVIDKILDTLELQDIFLKNTMALTQDFGLCPQQKWMRSS